MRIINQQQIKAVIALTGPKRYSHFIKFVADTEEVWGLYRDGWALAATNDENKLVLPVWPAKEYAAICKKNHWSDYEPRSIYLSDFMESILPDLESQGILPCIFYLPTDKGVVPELKLLLNDLQEELDKY